MGVVKAWHFVNDKGKRRDGLVEEVGKTYHFDGEPVMCECGLHASRRAVDALQYAPGAIVRRVSCWGIADEQGDKLVCKHRKVLWQKDVTNVLHEFACRVAEDALRTAKVKDKRCWAAIDAKRKWLVGEISDKELDAAWDAAGADAGDAAWDAAGDAARAAARAAARDAARAAADAAWAAAGAAAWAAAGAAAWAAARDAARDKYNTWLEDMIALSAIRSTLSIKRDQRVVKDKTDEQPEIF